MLLGPWEAGGRDLADRLCIPLDGGVQTQRARLDKGCRAGPVLLLPQGAPG